MSFQLYSLDHAPPRLPVWQLILEDLGNPPPARVARVLGVGVRTVYRWNRVGAAPRSACLALFWLTRWGRSQVDVQSAHDAMVACSYVDSLRKRVSTLELQLSHVLALGETGSANGPLIGGLGGTPSTSLRLSGQPAAAISEARP